MVPRMGWDERREIEPEVLAGRIVLGGAVRRARLRHGLSQRQLGSYVLLDQTTISKLETAKLKGLRFSMVCRVIGMISRAGAFELPDVPTRRLFGEADENHAFHRLDMERLERDAAGVEALVHAAGV